MYALGTIFFVCLVYYLFKKRSLLAYRKGVKEVMAGDPAVGLEYLRKASRQGLTPNQEIQAAYAEVKYGNIKTAKEKLNLLLLNSKLKDSPRYQAQCMMGIIRLLEKDLASAKEGLQSLYDKGYRTTNFYATYGYMALLTKDPAYYTPINEEAYQYNPGNAVIADNYGLCLFLNGELDKAIGIYETVMEKEPNFPEAYYNFACVLEAAGDLKRAEDMAEEALNREFTGVTTIRREQVEGLLLRIRESLQ